MQKTYLILLFTFWYINTFAQGYLVIDGFQSSFVGSSLTNEGVNQMVPEPDTKRYFQIYLPEGYDENENKSYPVIYFLHGFGHNHTSYYKHVQLLDDLITTGALEPVILVKPDASVQDYLGSFYVNSKVHGNFEGYIVHELRDYVNKNYRTKKDQCSTALTGHGAGGFGALLYAIKHPEIYGSVACHAADPLITGSLFLKGQSFYDSVMNEIPNQGPAQKKIMPTNGPETFLLFARCAALSPKWQNEFGFSLPIKTDEEYRPNYLNKKLIPDLNVVSSWLVSDPSLLIESVSDDQLKQINFYFEVNVNDSQYTIEASEKFVDLLKQRNIPVTFYINSEKSFSRTCSLTPSRFSIPLVAVAGIIRKTMLALKIEKEEWQGSLPFPFLSEQSLIAVGVSPEQYYDHNSNVISDIQTFDPKLYKEFSDDIPQAVMKLSIEPDRFHVDFDDNPKQTEQSFYFHAQTFNEAKKFANS